VAQQALDGTLTLPLLNQSPILQQLGSTESSSTRAALRFFPVASEREARAKLELTRSIHVVRDLSKFLARLSRGGKVYHVWISFTQLEGLVDREI
jgi:hypothetical protein